MGDSDMGLHRVIRVDEDVGVRARDGGERGTELGDSVRVAF